jgi:hypothetical protein
MKILLAAIIMTAILAITIPAIMIGEPFANGLGDGDGGLHCVSGNGGDIYNLHGGCAGTYTPM